MVSSRFCNLEGPAAFWIHLIKVLGNEISKEISRLAIFTPGKKKKKGSGLWPSVRSWAHCSVRQGQGSDRADWSTSGVSSREGKVQQRVEHYCDITSSFLQHMMQNYTRKMHQHWYCMSSLVCGAGKGPLRCPCTKLCLSFAFTI